ncbi:helix-turn-helix domain-containing protein [Methylobacter sp.]|uniref:helix-turn-helix domain-containing protein n=1 Tax=Methylobacter sp. TaxID=2051955 RepID=UPI003DA2F6E2
METVPIYDVGESLPVSLDAFHNRPCALPFSHPDYVPPTPQEVDRLIKLKGWSQSEAAALVGVSFSPKKGSSTIRKWRTKPESDDARPIPYSAWRLLLLYAGVVAIDEGLAALDKRSNYGEEQ